MWRTRYGDSAGCQWFTAMTAGSTYASWRAPPDQHFQQDPWYLSTFWFAVPPKLWRTDLQTWLILNRYVKSKPQGDTETPKNNQELQLWNLVFHLSSCEAHHFPARVSRTSRTDHPHRNGPDTCQILNELWRQIITDKYWANITWHIHLAAPNSTASRMSSAGSASMLSKALQIPSKESQKSSLNESCNNRLSINKLSFVVYAVPETSIKVPSQNL